MYVCSVLVLVLSGDEWLEATKMLMHCWFIHHEQHPPRARIRTHTIQTTTTTTPQQHRTPLHIQPKIMADVEGYKAEIKRSFALVAPISIQAAAIFYPTLWEVDPSTKVRLLIIRTGVYLLSYVYAYNNNSSLRTDVLTSTIIFGCCTCLLVVVHIASYENELATDSWSISRSPPASQAAAAAAAWQHGSSKHYVVLSEYFKSSEHLYIYDITIRGCSVSRWLISRSTAAANKNYVHEVRGDKRYPAAAQEPHRYFSSTTM